MYCPNKMLKTCKVQCNPWLVVKFGRRRGKSHQLKEQNKGCVIFSFGIPVPLFSPTCMRAVMLRQQRTRLFQQTQFALQSKWFKPFLKKSFFPSRIAVCTENVLLHIGQAQNYVCNATYLLHVGCIVINKVPWLF